MASSDGIAGIFNLLREHKEKNFTGPPFVVYKAIDEALSGAVRQLPPDANFAVLLASESGICKTESALEQCLVTWVEELGRTSTKIKRSARKVLAAAIKIVYNDSRKHVMYEFEPDCDLYVNDDCEACSGEGCGNVAAREFDDEHGCTDDNFSEVVARHADLIVSAMFDILAGSTPVIIAEMEAAAAANSSAAAAAE